MKRVNDNNIFIFINLVIILAAALALRLHYLGDRSFPVNDGGMFYQMTVELIQNNFKLPVYTNYNQAQIPFAYPPLGFYMTGILSKVFKIELIQIYIYFPLFINILAIPFVYLLAKLLLHNPYYALLSTFFWSMAIPSYDWTIMGGGVTRSLALTSTFICLYSFVKYFRTHKSFFLVISAIFCALTGLSHLEGFWVLGISLVIFFLFLVKDHYRQYLFPLTGFIIGTAALLMPYVIPIIKNHGIQVFWNAFLTGGFSSLFSIASLVTFDFAGEFFISYIAVFAVIGIYHQLLTKNYILVLWTLILILFDARSLNRNILFPISLLATLGFCEVIIPFLFKNKNKDKAVYQPTNIRAGQKTDVLILSRRYYLLIPILIHIYLLAYLQIGFYLDQLHTINDPELQAFEWVNKNSATTGTFLIVPFKNGWQRDSVSEWFPALTGRKSILTVQGSEWLPDNGHASARDMYLDFRECFSLQGDCLNSELMQQIDTIDYVWLTKYDCTDENSSCYQSTIRAINATPDYELVYENTGVAIFSKE